jgi:glycosyltransferase involved in cell wall biosynthesis
MYNASRYLRECIDSVLGQTFHDFEFLIVDDGSTDDSVEIVESYADPRIRLIRREHDYIASLNCLIDEARGEYIARMDADDVMLPHRLQQQFDYMESHPDIDVLGAAAVVICADEPCGILFIRHPAHMLIS